MAKRSKKQAPPRPDWLPGLALVLAVFAAYLPTAWAGYLWDDDLVVTGNPVIVGPQGLLEIWTTRAADICPLTLTIFWCEHALWGVNPLPFHLINVLFHAASAVILWRILLRLKIPGAWLGAALWALHPVQVDSVAWVVELKNAQSGFFFLLAILFFVRWLGRPRRDWFANEYLATFAFAACAVTSKSSTMILPLELALLAWWIERRVNLTTLAATLPMLALSIASGVVSLLTQKFQFGLDSDSRWIRPWPERFAGAGDAIWFYLGKLIFPWPLMSIYPRWTYDPTNFSIYLPLIAAAVLFGVLWYFRNTAARPFFLAYAWFLIALVPVLGFANIYFFRLSIVADHFQYLASIGPLVLATALVTRYSEKILIWRFFPGDALLLLAGILTFRHAIVYQNEQSLWADNLAKNPSVWLGYNHRGILFMNQHRLADAIADFRKSIELNPVFPDAHNDLGVALSQSGHQQEALDQFAEAVRLNPQFADAYYDYGTALAAAGRLDEAIQKYRRALEIVPGELLTQINLGLALARQGKLDEAIAEFRDVSAAYPNNADVHNDIGSVLAQKGNLPAAQSEFERALQLRPGDPTAQANLQRLLQQMQQQPAKQFHPN